MPLEIWVHLIDSEIYVPRWRITFRLVGLFQKISFWDQWMVYLPTFTVRINEMLLYLYMFLQGYIDPFSIASYCIHCAMRRWWCFFHELDWTSVGWLVVTVDLAILMCVMRHLIAYTQSQVFPMVIWCKFPTWNPKQTRIEIHVFIVWHLEDFRCQKKPFSWAWACLGILKRHLFQKPEEFFCGLEIDMITLQYSCILHDITWCINL